MDNIPESARSGLDRVTNYPDYQPSFELGQALQDLAFDANAAREKYGDRYEIDAWEKREREGLESSDYWGGLVDYKPFTEEDLDLDPED